MIDDPVIDLPSSFNDLFMRGKYIPIVGKYRSYWNEILYISNYAEQRYCYEE